MHRSATVEPSLKKRNTPTANPRRLNARAGSSKDFSTVDLTPRYPVASLPLPRPSQNIGGKDAHLVYQRFFQKRVSQALEGL